MIKNLALLTISLILTSCSRDKSTLDQNGFIEKLGTPSKLEYYRNIAGTAFQYDTPTFIITDNQELKEAIGDIKNADNPELWKGAGWNRVKIFYADTVLTFNSSNKKIGVKASGTFYNLPEKNFITKQLK